MAAMPQLWPISSAVQAAPEKEVDLAYLPCDSLAARSSSLSGKLRHNHRSIFSHPEASLVLTCGRQILAFYIDSDCDIRSTEKLLNILDRSHRSSWCWISLSSEAFLKWSPASFGRVFRPPSDWQPLFRPPPVSESFMKTPTPILI